MKRDDPKNRLCVMCLLHILCCGLVAVSVACEHLGLHIWMGDGPSPAFLLPGQRTDSRVSVQRCCCPEKGDPHFHSFAALLATF